MDDLAPTTVESFTVRPDAKDYVGKLVDAINDNAKIARTTGLALLLTGLYLIAAIFSASDEAILRGTTAKVGQLGIEIPLVLSFSIAPPIFAFLHINALIQFDHLTRLLGRLEDLLSAHVPRSEDRRHYRSVLTSAAFVPLQALRAGRREDASGDEAGLAGRVGVALYALIEWFTIACFPVVVLVASQLGFLRYQSSAITLTHTLTLLCDLAALWWFYVRRRGDRQSSDDHAGWRARLRPAAPLMLGTGIVIAALMTLFAQIAAPDATTVGRHQAQRWWQERHADGWPSRNLAALATQPVDLLLCGWQDRFCRFLQARNTVLLGREPSAPILAALARGELRRQQLDEIVGLSLRSRVLRFADFAEAKLPKADLIGADLRGARLADAQIQAADLRLAVIGGADFSRSHLEGANLYEAFAPLARFAASRMQGARLERGGFAAASFEGANLLGADLEEAQLLLTDFTGARLEGALLKEADLSGAILARADLDAAVLDGARLLRADLDGASLVGASLFGAKTGEACMRAARVAATDLRTIDEPPAEALRIVIAKRALDFIANWQIGRPSERLIERLAASARCTTPVWQQSTLPGPVTSPEDAAVAESPAFNLELTATLARLGCADEAGASAVLRRLRMAADTPPPPGYVRMTASALLAETCTGTRALSDSARAALARMAGAARR